MEIGVIGTGNMGKVLIQSFIESAAVAPSSMTITNRTIQKATAIQEVYPDLHVADSTAAVIEKADVIFICVKPLEIHPLLCELKSQLTSEKCIVSITSPLSVTQLESIVECHVARVIPSITNRALSGVSLVTFGENCNDYYRKTIRSLFEKISTPIEIDNNITRIASDIVSCGPAFFSYLLQRFIDGAVQETEITKEQATALTSGMIIGMGKLLEKEIYTLPTLQEKVCVKGGVTGEGIKVLESEIGELFEHLVQATHAKYYEDIEKIGVQFHQR